MRKLRDWRRNGNGARAEAPSPEAADGAPLIDLDEVWKIYEMGEFHVNALAGVSLRVDRGAYAAIMGPSGSGKSTLMNLVGCLDRPTRGDYALAGQHVADLEDDELATVRLRRMGFVFQSFNLLPRHSALQNVMMPLIYAGKSHKAERAAEALASVGLAERLHHMPNQLSGGQAQRVAIARAIVNDPEVILADEPTGALDSRSGTEVMALLESLNARGITLIVVTHEPRIAQRAGRVIRLEDGRIVADATGEEARTVAAMSLTS